MFGLLRDPSLAQEIERESRCRFDEWSLGFVTRHVARDGLQSDGCLSELKAIAQMMELETASVEASHATIRRAQHVVSCQTHSEHMLDGSAEWVLRRFRALRPERSRRAGSGLGGKQSAGEGRLEAKPKRKRGSGGPWRAYIRQCSLGSRGRPDLALLAERYRELAPEDKVVLLQTGKAATRAAKIKPSVGQSAFVMNARQQLRKHRKRALEDQVARQLHHEPSAPDCAGGAPDWSKARSWARAGLWPTGLPVVLWWTRCRRCGVRNAWIERCALAKMSRGSWLRSASKRRSVRS